jgi:putative DNA primase/helicase
MLTNMAGTVYDPRATCPRWDKFMLDVMGGDAELVSYIQRAVGYSLTGSTKEQCLFMLHGGGQNGKSTFLEVIQFVLGSYALASPMAAFLDKGKYGGSTIPNDIARLRGIRFTTAVETESGAKLAEAQVKQLTGSDTVSARFLHQEFFDFRPKFKLWLGVNYKPVIVGVDEGIWRRVHLVPWLVSFQEGVMLETAEVKLKDTSLPSKLKAESAGILRWAVQGLLAYRQVGLKEPNVVKDATQEYRSEEDTLKRFLEEETVESVADYVALPALYTRYTEWVGKGAEVLTKGKFLESMKAHGIKTSRPYVDGKQVSWKAYLGLRLCTYFDRSARTSGGGAKEEKTATPDMVN